MRVVDGRVRLSVDTRAEWRIACVRVLLVLPAQRHVRAAKEALGCDQLAAARDRELDKPLQHRFHVSKGLSFSKVAPARECGEDIVPLALGLEARAHEQHRAGHPGRVLRERGARCGRRRLGRARRPSAHAGATTAAQRCERTLAGLVGPGRAGVVRTDRPRAASRDQRLVPSAVSRVGIDGRANANARISPVRARSRDRCLDQAEHFRRRGHVRDASGRGIERCGARRAWRLVKGVETIARCHRDCVRHTALVLRVVRGALGRRRMLDIARLHGGTESADRSDDCHAPAGGLVGRRGLHAVLALPRRQLQLKLVLRVHLRARHPPGTKQRDRAALHELDQWAAHHKERARRDAADHPRDTARSGGRR
mmetsp:Transcript_6722/g.17196  ORF Transcript_6722/g.17196 Transcript_6722/m.17196 type:complete len:368 (+) Transcript_6722:3081-4184(+)